MAEFLNNIVNQNPINNIPKPADLLGKIDEQKDKFGNILNSPNRPQIPNPADALGELRKKLPEEQAKKALDKLKELSQKPKKVLQSVKRPAKIKPKSIPVPKKFKKAEIEKFKNFGGDLKSQAEGLKSQAQGLSSQAQGALSQAQGLASNLQNNANQNILSQAQNIKSNLGK